MFNIGTKIGGVQPAFNVFRQSISTISPSEFVAKVRQELTFGVSRDHLDSLSMEVDSAFPGYSLGNTIDSYHIQNVKWLINNLKAFKNQFDPPSEGASFDASITPAHRKHLINAIRRSLAYLDADDMAHFIAAVEPGVLQNLLKQVDPHYEITEEMVKGGEAPAREIGDKLTENELLALFDFHDPHSQTFMVSGSTHRLEAARNAGAWYHFSRSADEARERAYGKLEKIPHFTGRGLVCQAVKLERPGGSFLLLRLDHAYEKGTLIRLPHQVSGSENPCDSYLRKPRDGYEYSHLMEYREVKYLKTHFFNSTGEKERTILKGQNFRVVGKGEGYVPAEEAAFKKFYHTYTLVAVDRPREE